MSASTIDLQWQYDPRKSSLADYSGTAPDDSVADDLEDSLKLIGEHQRRLRANARKSLLLIIHGLDASGKDSLIRTLATYMDPAGFHAWSFGRPQGDETRHDFLWRVMPYLPAYGEVVAFNRSHHEAAIAERLWPIHGPEQYDWPTRYAAIRAFEKHLALEGTAIIKCWVRLSPDEQTKRLLKRLDKPRKQWKFDDSDIDAWQKRELYLQYAEEAIAATHIDEAPWLIVPGDKKAVARAIVAGILAKKLQELAPHYPPLNEKLLKKYRGLLSASLK